MQKTVYRTAIYARLSKDDGDKAESNSIASQKALCKEYISKHKDLEWVETFVDDGYSGVDFERPAFQQMEAALRDGRVNAVLCNIKPPHLIQYQTRGKTSEVFAIRAFEVFCCPVATPFYR